MRDPDEIAPVHCEQCGKDAEFLSKFSGWAYEIGDYTWMCSDCFEIATLEE